MTSGEKAEADDGGRVATGMLVSEARARDIKISAFSLALYGKVLVEDTTIELNQGGRYGNTNWIPESSYYFITAKW